MKFLNSTYLDSQSHFSFVCLDLEKIKAYIDSFRFGAPPHGGGGIGKLSQLTTATVTYCFDLRLTLIGSVLSK